MQFIPKSVIIVVDILFHGVFLFDILSKVNQNMGGYDHYSYLFLYPGLHRTSPDNRDETNQKFTDFHGYILATKDLRTLWITRITGIFTNKTILKSLFFNKKSRARARVGIKVVVTVHSPFR